MRSVYKTRHTNFLLKVDFTFLELFLAICGFCNLWTIFIRFELTSLYIFCAQFAVLSSWLFCLPFPLWVETFFWASGGFLCFTHTDYACAVSAFYLYVQLNGGKKTEAKPNKNSKEKSQIKENYLFPGRLRFSVAHAEGLAAFLIRAVVTYPSASQRT